MIRKKSPTQSLLPYFVLSFLCTPLAIAAEETVAEKPKAWAHESEVGIVVIDGNSESETNSVKQSTKYTRKKDSVTLSADYTESEQEGVTSAKSSSATLRYDRKFKGKLGGFTSHGVFSDKFAGVVQEDRSLLGATYEISKRDYQTWDAELGYQHSEFNYVGTDSDSLDLLNTSTKYTRKLNENVDASAKVTYRDAFANGKNQVTGKKDKQYWVDTELSLAVVMTKALSLKLGYEHKYQNFKPATATKRVDTKFTTALTAKF